MPPKKTVPGQQSFADVLKKTIEEKEKEKKEENEEEEEEEEKEEEVIMLGDSTTSDGQSSESYVPSDSVSNPLGDSELVRDKGTLSWKMRSMKEEEEEEEEEKRKKKGLTGGEKRVMSSPGSADKKRAEHAKKQKEGGGDDDNDDDDDDDDSEGDAPTKDLRMEMARANSDVSKTPLKSVASARAVAPKAKTGKRTKSETMEPTTMMNVWNKNQVSALIDCLIRTLYLQFGTATGGDVDHEAIEKYRKSNRSLMPLVKVESLNNPLTRERIFQSNTAIEDKWKNVMKAVNTSDSEKILAIKIFATTKEDFESITDDRKKFKECITMMNVFNCFPTSTELSEEAPLKTLFKGDEGSAWKSLAERAKVYDSKRSDDWWDRVHIAKKIYTILDQPYAGGRKKNTLGYNSEQQKSQKMATFVDAAVHEESQRENMVDVFSRAKKVVQRYEESANNKAELFKDAIALKKECMKYVFNVYKQKDANVEKTRKELDRLVENPSADAGGSDSEDKSFDDWVDERAIELWQHWAFGGGEENENLAEFFEHYVKMRERNRPSSDEE